MLRGICIAIAAVGLWIVATWHGTPWGSTASPKPGEPRLVPLSAATVESPFVCAPGFVEGPTREVGLRFENEGRLVSVEVGESARVAAGQVLARLDDATQSAELVAAEAALELAVARRERLVNGATLEERRVAWAEVEVARVRAALTRIEGERSARLHDDRTITRAVLDGAEHAARDAAARLDLAEARAAQVEAEVRPDELRIAEVEVARARAAVQLARAHVERSVLRAPSHGVVLRVDHEPGDVVGPTTAVPTMTFTGLGRLRVRAMVEEFDALRVRVGQPCEIVAEGRPEHRHRGVVVACSPGMTAKRHRTDRPGERFDVRVREVLVELGDSGELVVGLPVDVTIDVRDVGPGSESGDAPATAGAARAHR